MRPDTVVLNGLSLSVRPGHVLALVGPSGCGKSTVVSLLERFYDPDTGSVHIDDNDTSTLRPSVLRNTMSLVGQEPILFAASIAENIRYGREAAGFDEVVAAAKLANLHDFVESLPDKYDTLVGEKGTQLSGGQKQRVAIARALVREPKLLLLDEATSALDAESEKIVQEALDRASAGRTTIVIAHRLSTVRNAHAIAVVRGGRIVELGRHDDLIAQKGFYRDLVSKQMQDITH
eukprot:Opistho-2@29922